MPRCLITGASGFLGAEVYRRMSRAHDVTGLGHARAASPLWGVDLRDAEQVERVVKEAKPDMVVHCAAYRDPDFCEAHPEEARWLNVDAVSFLCAGLDERVPLVFISTDYVFDGTRPPYREGAPTSPVNVYGRTKVEAEDRVRSRSRGVVLRVGLLVGAGPTLEQSGFIAQMRAAVLNEEPQELDNVLVRFPTWTRDVAELVAFLLSSRSSASGLYHYSGLRGATRYQWTLEMAGLLRATAGHLKPSNRVIPRRAARPRDAQLLPERLMAMGYARFTDFAEVVKDVLASFNGQCR